MSICTFHLLTCLDLTTRQKKTKEKQDKKRRKEKTSFSLVTRQLSFEEKKRQLGHRNCLTSKNKPIKISLATDTFRYPSFLLPPRSLWLPPLSLSPLLSVSVSVSVSVSLVVFVLGLCLSHASIFSCLVIVGDLFGLVLLQGSRMELLGQPIPWIWTYEALAFG